MKHKLSKVTLAVLSASAMSMTSYAYAAEEATAEEEVEVIQVTGIRSSLTSAILEKRDADNLVEVIIADDIGKLPDQNLAEVLENILVFKSLGKQVLVQAFKFVVLTLTAFK